MKKKHSHFRLLSAICCIAVSLFFSCQNEPKTVLKTLAAAKQLLEENKTVRYAYQATWDNRFNSSIFRDSAKIIYSKLDNNPFGFGVRAEWGDKTITYDGTDYYSINHTDKEIIKTEQQTLNQDTNFFQHKMIFHAHPNELLGQASFTAMGDTLQAAIPQFFYKKSTVYTSEDNAIVEQQRFYFIDQSTNLLTEAKHLTIIDADTVQTISYAFSDYHFEKEAVQFKGIEGLSLKGYTSLRSSDKQYAMTEKLVAVGEQLSKSQYQDMTGIMTNIFGTKDKQTLMMFSFIGCGGCEAAMRAMKKRDYQLRPNLQLYYSSPRDSNEALKKYFEKKGFPFGGFGAESNMNDDFSAYAFPTFVLIDEKGVVQSIHKGYNEAVDELLF